MRFQEIKNKVYYCGLNDCDRKMFDELIPLENGTSYNSYLVLGSEKVALIDTMYPPKSEIYLTNLAENGVTKVDYIIANHGEQDHTGTLPQLIVKYPEAVILTNPKCKENIKEMLLIPDEKIQVVADGEEVSLGDKTLKFIYAPGVHWPDTMFTFLKEDNILCTCDFLGAHYTFEDVFANDSEELYKSAKRYYAEIMMPFRPLCKKYTKMVREMNPEMILPSHGPVYKNSDFILSAYEEWTADEGKNLVLMPYVSMYNSTTEMINYLAEKLESKGVKCEKFDVVNNELGELAIGLVDATSIVFGCSMVLGGPHPMAVGAAYLVNVLKPKAKLLSMVGSYGWGGRLFEKLQEEMSGLRCEMIEPILAKGKPKALEFKKLEEMADTIFNKHKELGLI